MTDTRITRNTLANSFKELMRDNDFSKISVADICRNCNINRKSFYYHFHDKYDLVNWIFDRDYSGFVYRNKGTSFFLRELCDYFFENSTYYRKVFMIQGQNCFSWHLHDHFFRILNTYKKDDSSDFKIHFYSDAIVASIKRWLDNSTMNSELFSKELENVIKQANICNALD
ncbi:MAG: TetR/AcrR family transcriptional regulator C-terminal domain-containing protein [Erysipelotrichaceae bacterium]